MIKINFSIQPLSQNRNIYYDFAKEKNFGIETVTFAMPNIMNNKLKYNEEIKKHKIELRSINTLKSFHGPFIDITIHSIDKEIADISKQKIEKSINTALDLNCKFIVFHSGINTLIKNPNYIKNVINLQSDYWLSMLDKYNEIIICIENMWESTPDTFKQLIKSVNNERFKVCFDTGHANIFSTVPIENWIEELSSDIIYMHWNDNFKDIDSELAVGQGNIDWKKFIYTLQSKNINSTVVFEVGSIEKIKISLNYLEKNNLLKIIRTQNT